MAGIIFDLDGLLIDSEPLWQAAEMSVFSNAGLHLTAEDCTQTQGFRVAEVVRHWAAWESWSASEQSEIVNAITEEVLRLISERAVLMPGAQQAIERAHNRGPLAIASSSPIAIIRNVLDRFSISGAFACVVSAESEELGKPHPAVFLKTAMALNCAPQSCIVFEDSFNGVLAAKAARMTCIAVPSSTQSRDPRFCIADKTLRSLLEVTEELIVNRRA